MPRFPRGAAAAVLAFLGLQLALGFAFIRSATPTFDETAHLAGGYSTLMTGDYRFNAMDHPPFAEVWSGLPLAFFHLDAFAARPDWIDGRPYHYADYFLYHNKLDAGRILNIGRAFAFLTWTLLLAGGLCWWSFRLGGPAAAVGTAAAAALCPPLISNLALANTDGASAVLFFLVFCLLSAAEEKTARSIRLHAAAGFCAGLALAAKFNMIILPPLALGLLAADRFLSGRPKDPLAWLKLSSLAACLLLAMSLIYRFGHFGLYWKGLIATLSRLGEGRSSFLLGHYSESGFWLYFPVAFAVKLPLPVLALGLWTLWRWLPRSRAGADRGRLWVLAPFLGYFAAAVACKVQIGIRHLLPAMPFFMILAGCGAARLWKRSRLALAALAVWAAASVGHCAPHLLAYFNEACGGPENGYRVLVDSNLDWGQDIKGLASFLKDMGNPPIYLSYFGTADPAYYGIRYAPVFCAPHVDRPGNADPAASGRVLFAISATNLQGPYFRDKALFAWLKERRPLRVIGYSIFLYDLTRDPEGKAKLARLLPAEARLRLPGKHQRRSGRTRPYIGVEGRVNSEEGQEMIKSPVPLED